MERRTWMWTGILVAGLGIGRPVVADVEVGKPAPDFTLPTQDGSSLSLSSYKGKFVVLEWFNPGCPFVRKHYDSGNMQKLQETYTGKGVVWLSINSSAPGKEGNQSASEAGDLHMKWAMKSNAILLDPDGKVGRLYKARTTPHMFVIDPSGKVIYQGAIDDKASTDAADIASSKNYVAAALDAAMVGKPVATPSTRPYGCSVKYQ